MCGIYQKVFFTIPLLFLGFSEDVLSGYISKGETCTGDCDPKKALMVYPGWTEYESYCDAVPIGTIEITGRADPLQFEFRETAKLFSEIQAGFADAALMSCGSEEARRHASSSASSFSNLEGAVSPGLKAYDCSASGVSPSERMELVNAAITKIRESEPFLRDFLRKTKALTTPMKNNWNEKSFPTEGCDSKLYFAWLGSILINAHEISCRLYFAERTINFTLNHGMNPILANTCEIVREPAVPAPMKKEKSANTKIEGSDITGINGN